MVKTSCSGRKEFYFGPENDFTIETSDEKAAGELLASRLHKFQVVIPAVPKEEIEKPVHYKPEHHKKEEKKHGKKA